MSPKSLRALTPAQRRSQQRRLEEAQRTAANARAAQAVAQRNLSAAAQKRAKAAAARKARKMADTEVSYAKGASAVEVIAGLNDDDDADGPVIEPRAATGGGNRRTTKRKRAARTTKASRKGKAGGRGSGSTAAAARRSPARVAGRGRQPDAEHVAAMAPQQPAFVRLTHEEMVARLGRFMHRERSGRVRTAEANTADRYEALQGLCSHVVMLFADPTTTAAAATGGVATVTCYPTRMQACATCRLAVCAGWLGGAWQRVGCVWTRTLLTRWPRTC